MVINKTHISLGIDPIWTGLDVYQIKDLSLLQSWWTLLISKASDKVTGTTADKRLQEFYSALWIRINQLHPKFLLRFSDITTPKQ